MHYSLHRRDIQYVLLFGSSIVQKEARDIDRAIKGIDPSKFFQFYRELILSIPKSIDVINLDKKCSFNALIEKESIRLHV